MEQAFIIDRNGLPLTCGGICIGQTGRCLNDRLREHKLNVKNKNNYGHLSVHCVECGCTPLYASCSVLAKHKDKDVREIIEAHAIFRKGDACVSAPSVDLLDRERAFLLG